jgi:hypothetical protein
MVAGRDVEGDWRGNLVGAATEEGHTGKHAGGWRRGRLGTTRDAGR